MAFVIQGHCTVLQYDHMALPLCGLHNLKVNLIFTASKI